MAKKLTVDVLTEKADVANVRDAWHALALDVRAQPFGLPAPALSWFEHLGKGQLHVVTAHTGGGELIGLAPMHRRTRGGIDVLEFLGRGLGAVGGLLVGESKQDVAGALVERLTLDDGPALDLVEFEVRGRGLEQLRRQDRFATDVRLQNECPVIDLTGVRSGEDFLAAPERSGLRKKIAKAERQLEDRSFTVDVATTSSEIGALRPAIDSIYDAAELAAPRLHLGHPPYADFFADLLDGLARRTCLAVVVGRVDQRPVAFDVHVVVGGVAYAILGRIDPAYQQFSPGHLVLRAGIDWAVERGLDMMDLQIGSDEYKLRWSTSTYDTASVVAAPMSRIGRARRTFAAVEAAHRTRERVKERLTLDR